MNDPWHVKSVKLSDQYVSCMKINGTPLLPPVLSKECRNEMQYYKLLAKEVEKRISTLKPYNDSDSDCDDNEDIKTQVDKNFYRELESGYDPDNKKVFMFNAMETATAAKYVPNEPLDNIKSSVVVSTTEGLDAKVVLDLSLTINESNNILEAAKKLPQYISPIPVELPEHDYDTKPLLKELTDTEEPNESFSERTEQTTLTSTDVTDKKDVDLASPSLEAPLQNYTLFDSPISISSKSFTGSLIDIHYETSKEADTNHKLIRQSSYTLLEPSPQLLAHLKQQSMKTGANLDTISMSESVTNLTSPTKKRKGWDLESAKEKWSSMARELNRHKTSMKISANTRVTDTKTNVDGNGHVSRQAMRKSSPAPHTNQARARSVAMDSNLRRSPYSKTSPKSDPLPVQKVKNQANSNRRVTASKTFVIESNPNKPLTIQKTTSLSQTSPTRAADADDPAARVRQLYEKIQKQQQLQMTSLVEKQKREQMLLQQMFEEQNNMLFKQLKTICPKSSIEIKAAWGDKSDDRGPVSLRQVINHTPNSNAQRVSSPLQETSNFINRCDDILKKSKDISSRLDKRHTLAKFKTPNGNQSRAAAENTPPPTSPKLEGSRTRTHSPSQRNTARKLNYDTSISLDYEPALTDRTNDTLADLNVTFTTDEDEFSGKQWPMKNSPRTPAQRPSPQQRSSPPLQSAASTLKQSHTSRFMNGCRARHNLFGPVTPQKVAAATTIAAHARGYLVRRLLRTERVQATVQTIRDALLCALELHQDREGIRGADVDLHRRLIQQITAACYSLHDTFVASTPAERCAMIAADRGRRRSLAARQASTPAPRGRHPGAGELMSQSHSGAFPARAKRPSPAGLMTHSSYEMFSSGVRGARRRPWR